LAEAKREIEELKKQKTPPPAFVKANVLKTPEGEKEPRKKREAKHNHGRRREVPTRIVEHQIIYCPQCRNRLGGLSEARRRQVIEMVPPPQWKSRSMWSTTAGVVSARSGAKRHWM